MTAATAAGLDDACLRMLPAARQLVAAVRNRDHAAARAAFDHVQRTEMPPSAHPMTVLALVLADEVVNLEAIPADSRVAAYAKASERERCRLLAVSVLQTGHAEILERARRLPSRIASGDRP